MSIYPFCISHLLYFKLSFLERFWFAFINSVVSFFSFATYAMHWYASKMIEIYELISMHSYKNLNTFFYAMSSQLWIRILQGVYNKPFLCNFQHGKKKGEREKKLNGGTKAINWSSRTVRNQLQSSSSSHHRLIPFSSTCSYRGDLISSSTFSFHNFPSFHHPQQHSQVLQQSTNINSSTAPDFLGSVCHSCYYFSNPRICS